MERMKRTCGNCYGMGRITRWYIGSEDKDSNISTMLGEEAVCENCSGQGWTEYAVFSVEEAEAILKHCGLNTESEEV